MKIFFSVGEPSGDLHGANLIQELRSQRPQWELCGFGGPRMKAAGCEILADLTELAVMWFFRVLLHVPRFLAYLRDAERLFRSQKPDAVVLIDFPGFNWWIARRAKAHGIPVFYYGVPQLWAWAPWRINKLRRLTDHILCKLPFEPDWFCSRGCNAHYVGHPYYDELAARQIDQQFIEQITLPGVPRVTLLPGSRTQEVVDNLEMMLSTCQQIARKVQPIQFSIASFNEKQANIAKEMLGQWNLDADIHVNRTPELITAAKVCIACSGSVSLELLYHGKPSVVVYRVSRLAFEIQDRVRSSKYISLANLLACRDIDRKSSTREKVPFPEYLTYEDESSNIARDIVHWLTDERRFDATVSELHALREKYAHPGASSCAARYLIEHVTARMPLVPQPHFSSVEPAKNASIR